jgi:hypothetical protein
VRLERQDDPLLHPEGEREEYETQEVIEDGEENPEGRGLERYVEVGKNPLEDEEDPNTKISPPMDQSCARLYPTITERMRIGMARWKNRLLSLYPSGACASMIV